MRQPNPAMGFGCFFYAGLTTERTKNTENQPPEGGFCFLSLREKFEENFVKNYKNLIIRIL